MKKKRRKVEIVALKVFAKSESSSFVAPHLESGLNWRQADEYLRRLKI